MLLRSKVNLSIGVVVCVVATIWILQPKHMRDLDTKGPSPEDTPVWECAGAYCTGPGL